MNRIAVLLALALITQTSAYAQSPTTTLSVTVNPATTNITVGPTTLSNSTFNAIAGDANKLIGVLSTATSSGVAIPHYSLRTPTDGLSPSCSTACADSSKFAIAGGNLNVGAADVVCASSPCSYQIIVRDTDTQIGVSNSPFDQALTVTGTSVPANIVLGPTTISNTSFVAGAGNAKALIGTLSTAASSGTALPNYTLRTSTDGLSPTCTTACADSGKFAVSGINLNVGNTDIVCTTSPCTYNITVRDTDSAVGVSNSPFDQALTLTGVAPGAGGVSLAPLSFPAVAGNASQIIGTLSLVPPLTYTYETNGTPDTVYSLISNCGVNCTNSAQFTLTTAGQFTQNRSLNIGGSDLVCAPSASPCPYDITVQATDPSFAAPVNTHYHLLGYAPQAGTPQWLFPPAPNPTDCILSSNNVTSWTCDTQWTTSFTNNSLLVLVKYCASSGCPVTTTPAPAPTVTIVNSAAVCAPIPGANAGHTTTGLNYDAFLCPNLKFPANRLSAAWTTAISQPEITVFEIYGCTTPCVAEGGNGISQTFSAGTNTFSIPTAAPTTAANDIVISAVTSNNTWNPTTGSCCTRAFTGGNGYTLGEYQIGATPNTYTNSWGVSKPSGSVTLSQVIVALQRNAAPAVAAPQQILQKAYSVLDTAAAGTAVGTISATTVDRSMFLGSLALNTNPGGLLNFNATTGQLTLGTTLTPSADGTYAGQVSATSGGSTLAMPISLIVAPPPTAKAGTNCPSPPLEALRAGYTTLVYCMDGASARYANTANWLGCNNSNSPAQPGLEWYADYAAINCPDWSQALDSVTGKQTLQFHWHSDPDCNAMNALTAGTGCVIRMYMGRQLWGQSSITKPFVDFPIGAYYEVKARFSPLITDTFQPEFPPDFFLWSQCPDKTQANCNSPNHWGLLEMDFFEYYGPRDKSGGTVVHDWYPGVNQGLVSMQDPPTKVPGWNGVNNLHRYGNLFTTNGHDTIRMAAYIDDVNMGHSPQIVGNFNPYDLPVLPTQQINGFDERRYLNLRSYFNMWVGGTFGLTTSQCQSSSVCIAEGGQPDTFYNYEYIAVWSCAQWAIDPTCQTNGLTQ